MKNNMICMISKACLCSQRDDPLQLHVIDVYIKMVHNKPEKESRHSKRCYLPCVTSEDTDQTTRKRGAIRVVKVTIFLHTDSK